MTWKMIQINADDIAAFLNTNAITSTDAFVITPGIGSTFILYYYN